MLWYPFERFISCKFKRCSKWPKNSGLSINYVVHGGWVGWSEKHYVALRKGVGGWVKVKNTTTLHYVRYMYFFALVRVSILNLVKSKVDKLISLMNYIKNRNRQRCAFIKRGLPLVNKQTKVYLIYVHLRSLNGRKET